MEKEVLPGAPRIACLAQTLNCLMKVPVDEGVSALAELARQGVLPPRVEVRLGANYSGFWDPIVLWIDVALAQPDQVRISISL